MVLNERKRKSRVILNKFADTWRAKWRLFALKRWINGYERVIKCLVVGHPWSRSEVRFPAASATFEPFFPFKAANGPRDNQVRLAGVIWTPAESITELESISELEES